MLENIFLSDSKYFLIPDSYIIGGKVKDYANTSIVAINPYRHDKGLKPAKDLLRTLYIKNNVYSFEIWFENRAKVVFCSSESELELRKKITSFYPAAGIYRPERDYISDMLDKVVNGTLAQVDSNNVIENYSKNMFCTARADLEKGYCLPLRTDFDVDPLNTLLTSMIGLKAVYQVVFTPAPQKWMRKAVKGAESLTKGRVVGWLNPRIEPAGSTEKELSKQMINRAGMPAFAVKIRIAVFGESESIYNFESFFRLFHNPVVGQGFKLTVSNQFKELEKMRNREVSIPRFFGRKNVLTCEELAALVHIPGEELHVRELEWTFARKDLKPPA